MERTRIKELCDKLYHPRNSLCRHLMPKWFNDSLEWATSMSSAEKPVYALRLRYMLNRLCPSLVHLLPKPIYNYYSPDACSLKSMMYEFENTQARVCGCNGEVISSGVGYTLDEWKFFVCSIFPIVGGETKVCLEDYFHSVGIVFPLDSDLSGVLQEYTEKYVNLSNSEN